MQRRLDGRIETGNGRDPCRIHSPQRRLSATTTIGARWIDFMMRLRAHRDRTDETADRFPTQVADFADL
jgi:hypothetical protein